MKILEKSNIITNLATESPEEVIRRCGKMLVDSGYVKENYIEGMLARDKNFSVAIGNLIAIPHGEMAYKADIIETGLVVLTYPNGIDWNGMPVKLVVGIAAKGDEHLEILETIVEAFEEEEDVEKVVKNADTDSIYRLLVAED